MTKLSNKAESKLVTYCNVRDFDLWLLGNARPEGNLVTFPSGSLLPPFLIQRVPYFHAPLAVPGFVCLWRPLLFFLFLLLFPFVCRCVQALAVFVLGMAFILFGARSRSSSGEV